MWVRKYKFLKNGRVNGLGIFDFGVEIIYRMNRNIIVNIRKVVRLILEMKKVYIFDNNGSIF